MLASSNPSSSKTYLEQHPRLTNHLVLAGLTLIGCLISAVFATPGQALFETMSVGTGYIGLLLIFASLVIGPINMLKVRKNPVNIMVRRDIGIWAGITSLVHVVFSGALQLSWGDSLLGLFFYKSGALKLNLFGISDMFGLLGALIVLFLLVLSNNYFLKKLKGKNWKKMQRFNYLLFAVALIHALTQQLNNSRGIFMIFAVTALAIGVMVAQSIGFVIYRKREQQRKPAAAPRAAKPVASPVSIQPGRVSPVEPRYVAPVIIRKPSPLPKVAMYAIAGVLTIFAGFEIGQQGSQLVNSVITANNSTTTSTSSSSNTVNSASTSSSTSNSSTSSSSSSSASVSQPSSSQPSVRTQHS